MTFFKWIILYYEKCWQHNVLEPTLSTWLGLSSTTSESIWVVQSKSLKRRSWNQNKTCQGKRWYPKNHIAKQSLQTSNLRINIKGDVLYIIIWTSFAIYFPSLVEFPMGPQSYFSVAPRWGASSSQLVTVLATPRPSSPTREASKNRGVAGRKMNKWRQERSMASKHI